MKTNTRRMGLMIVAAMLPLLALGVQPARASAVYIYDFEQALEPWGPGTGGMLVLDRGDNLCPLQLGTGMAVVAAPAKGADSPDLANWRFAFMTTRYAANPGDTVVVDWSAKTPKDYMSGDAAVVYVGRAVEPTIDSWMAPIGQKGPNGWVHYHYETLVVGQSYSTPLISVALGVRGTGGVLQPLGLGIDCVQVRILANTN